MTKTEKVESGQVKFYNPIKGLGFITPDTGGRDVFVHKTGLVESIDDGDKVSFVVMTNEKGQFATQVHKIYY